ncbi:MAG: DUF2828 family protein [Bacilli bacterium]
MTTLFQAVTANTPKGLTDNGCATHLTTMNACLDLFAIIGSSRGQDISDVFHKALQENAELAIRILLHARDCRGGSGERKTVTDLVIWMNTQTDYKAYVKPVLAKLPELGYWKDLVNLYAVKGMSFMINPMFAKALRAKDGLCAKYLPRKGPVARGVRRYMKLREDVWRKLLVSLSSTVETQMCANQWHDINYSHVPSKASTMYRKAFRKHDQSRYAEFIDKANKGEVKINSGVLNPIDIVSKLSWNVDHTLEAQWKQLPDYIQGAKGILPIVDVSGSMNCNVPGTQYTAMMVAMSLGVYVSERLSGSFKDQYVTFTSTPTFAKLKGNTLRDRISDMRRADWGMNTNLTAVFDMILGAAIEHSVPEDEMPGTIMIVSDMQFDSCIRDNRSTTAFAAIKSAYATNGYTMPKVVFWNVNATQGNNPVTMLDKNTCLVSGFSASMMTNILSCKEMTPVSLMLDAVMKDRYSFV